ncbi:hypothetical protein PROFUN_02292 [Planoprotostelium fungivorum]|uniref:Homeobox domain-containing protein n=1 Tax=Planoprotostelium fungivorum TaxID=1890364 RepID=A0A2P6NYH8_9EUKA|nr:hypothetical protein PROFUN_02292 [Planoprotostelium fungivorum]
MPRRQAQKPPMTLSSDSSSDSDGDLNVISNLKSDANHMEPVKHVVPAGVFPDRLDKYLPYALGDTSRSFVQRIVKEEKVTINGRVAKTSTKVKGGDVICLMIDPSEVVASGPRGQKESNIVDLDTTKEDSTEDPSTTSQNFIPKWMVGVELQPQEMDLNIVYEDEHLAVVNKNPGLMVHPSPGHVSDTLVNGLLARYGQLSKLAGIERPGIVHRLDRDTAGLMIVARTDEAYNGLKEQFMARTTVKKYGAIVSGKPQGWDEPTRSVTISKPLMRHPNDSNKMVIVQNQTKTTEEGKEAVTEYRVERVYRLPKKEIVSTLDVQIHTGRTHQIRVHTSFLGCSIVGDPIYGKKQGRFDVPFLLLWSKSIQFTHPVTKKKMEYNIGPPKHGVMTSWIHLSSPRIQKKHPLDSSNFVGTGGDTTQTIRLRFEAYKREAGDRDMEVSQIVSPYNLSVNMQTRVFYYDPSSSDSRKTEDRKRPRRNFSLKQREELHRLYLRSPYPSLEEREQMAKRMHASERQIQVWFQNQRASAPAAWAKKLHALSLSYKNTQTDKCYVRGQNSMARQFFFPRSDHTLSHKTQMDGKEVEPLDKGIIMPYVRILTLFPGYRYLWMSHVVSLLGDWINELACVKVLSEYTDSALIMGSFIICRELAPLLVSPFTGVVADTFNRKKILLIADVLRCIIVLGFLLVRTREMLWLMFLLVAITSDIVSASSFFGPAVEALIPQIVTPSYLSTANIFLNVTWSLILMSGAGVGGLITSQFGTDISFLVDAGTYVLSAVFILRLMTIPLVVVGEEISEKKKGIIREFWKSYSDGFKFLWSNRIMMVVALSKATAGSLYASSEVAQIMLAGTKYLVRDDKSFTLSLMWIASGAGIAFGPIIINRFVDDKDKNNIGCIFAGVVLLTVSSAIFPFFDSIWPFLLCITVRSLGSCLCWVWSSTFLQRNIPNRMLGRVVAIEFAALMIATIMSRLAYGGLTDHLDVPADRAVGWVAMWGALLCGLWGVFLYKFKSYDGAIPVVWHRLDGEDEENVLEAAAGKRL